MTLNTSPCCLTRTRCTRGAGPQRTNGRWTRRSMTRRSMRRCADARQPPNRGPTAAAGVIGSEGQLGPVVAGS
eukprot:scaffold71690_cov32-Tisochrysis_lutea.AAC.1